MSERETEVCASGVVNCFGIGDLVMMITNSFGVWYGVVVDPWDYIDTGRSLCYAKVKWFKQNGEIMPYNSVSYNELRLVSKAGE